MDICLMVRLITPWYLQNKLQSVRSALQLLQRERLFLFCRNAQVAWGPHDVYFARTLEFVNATVQPPSADLPKF